MSWTIKEVDTKFGLFAWQCLGGSVASHISHGDVPLELSCSSTNLLAGFSFAKLRLASTAGGLRLGDRAGATG